LPSLARSELGLAPQLERWRVLWPSQACRFETLTAWSFFGVSTALAHFNTCRSRQLIFLGLPTQCEASRQ